MLRLVSWIGLSLLVVASLTGTAVAQPGAGGQQQHPDDRPDPAPADTTRHPTIFDRLGFHPELSSSYDVNRSATTFQQRANVRKHFGPTLVDSDWNVSVQSNSRQNDRRQVAGLGKTRVARRGLGRDGWAFGSEFGVSRRAVTTTFTKNIVNTTNIDLIGETGAPGSLLREQFGLEEETLEWGIDGKFGAVRDDNINERRSRSDPTELQSADSTRADGSTWELASDLGIVPAEDWRIDLSAGMTRGRQAYDTQLRTAADPVDDQSGTNRNRSRELDIATAWRPSKGREVRFRAAWDVSRSQYFSTTEKAQETTDGNGRNLDFAVLAEPFWGIATELRAQSFSTATRFQRATSGAGKDGYSVDAKTSFTFGRAFGWLDGVEASVEGKSGTTSTTYQDITPAFDEDVVYLRGLLKKAWSRGTSATLGATGDLSQKFYEQPETGAKQDQDRLKQRVDFALSYQLTPSVETVFNVNWSKTSTINILAERAAANVDETSLSTGGSYTWTIWRQTKLIQDLVVNAASSTRPYNEDESSLRRTTKLRSTLESLLWERANIRLEHFFQFQDQGAYRIDTGSIRAFLKDTESLHQKLESEIRYMFRPGFTVYYEQKFEIRGSENLITGAVNERLTTELRWGGDFRHNIDADFYVDVGFDRVSSTVESSYWIGGAQVSRLF